MRTWREHGQALDLTSDSHVANAMRLTQARRRLLNDLIGIRIARDFSQAQVARAIGINRSGINRFESDIQGSNPTIDVILRYAHAVGASVQMYAEPVEVAEKQIARRRQRQQHEVWNASLSSPPKSAGFVEARSEPVFDHTSNWIKAVEVGR